MTATPLGRWGENALQFWNDPHTTWLLCIPIAIGENYLKMRDEVGRDAALRLDSRATRLAVGFDFAILALEHNIKVIQNRHLRNGRHGRKH